MFSRYHGDITEINFRTKFQKISSVKVSECLDHNNDLPNFHDMTFREYVRVPKMYLDNQLLSRFHGDTRSD